MGNAQLFTPVRDTRKFKTELHGVRGLAISLVIAFHIFGQGRVSGGIDIFLAITGFLALPSLARRAQRGWHGWLINIPQRLAGLSRRLVVPLVPVLLAVSVAAWLILPLTQRDQALTEVAASALFYENWELINSQLTYDAAGPLTSPLQHLWSTSIQGQFHLVMIAFVIAIAFLCKRKRLNLRFILITALTVLTAASFAWAIWETSHIQERAYFSTFSRAWQLTGPGILGLTVSRLRIPPLIRGIMSWAGFALIASCGAVMDGALYFPGPRALWPIAGICLVLAAGDTRTSWGADRLLGTAPFQRLGDISYSLYLWHWPVLIFTLAALRQERVTVPLALVVLAVSLALGTAGYRLFEQRALNTPLLSLPHLPAAIGLASMLLVSFGARAGSAYADELAQAEILAAREQALNRALETDPNYPGSAVLHGYPQPAEEPILPSEDVRTLDHPWHYTLHKEEACVQRGEGTDAILCESEELSEGPLVLLAGASHTGQWSDAIAVLARVYGWRLVVMECSGCPLTTDAMGTRGGPVIGEVCETWNANAMAKIKKMKPDLVIAQATTRRTNSPDLVEIAPPGMIEAIDEINDAGIRTFLFRETTTVEHEMASCAGGTDAQLRACNEDRDHFYDPQYDGADAEDLGLDPAFADIFDPAPYLCDDETCYAVLGNVRVHRDRDHLTSTITRTIAPAITEQLRAFTPDLFELRPEE